MIFVIGSTWSCLQRESSFNEMHTCSKSYLLMILLIKIPIRIRIPSAVNIVVVTMSKIDHLWKEKENVNFENNREGIYIYIYDDKRMSCCWALKLDREKYRFLYEFYTIKQRSTHTCIPSDNELKLTQAVSNWRPSVVLLAVGSMPLPSAMTILKLALEPYLMILRTPSVLLYVAFW